MESTWIGHVSTDPPRNKRIKTPVPPPTKKITSSKMLGGIVSTVGTANGATIVCDPFAKTCEVNEATLAMFLNGGVKVQYTHIDKTAGQA